MRWTKLKQRIEARFVDALKERVRIDLTRYRWTQNEDGEIRVVVDGKRIYSGSYWAYVKERASGKTDDELTKNGIASDHFLAAEVFHSLNQSIEKMLTHKDPLIRGLAVLDKRCGKRQLQKLKIDSEHEFVQRTYAIRIAL